LKEALVDLRELELVGVSLPKLIHAHNVAAVAVHGLEFLLHAVYHLRELWGRKGQVWRIRVRRCRRLDDDERPLELVRAVIRAIENVPSQAYEYSFLSLSLAPSHSLPLTPSESLLVIDS